MRIDLLLNHCIFFTMVVHKKASFYLLKCQKLAKIGKKTAQEESIIGVSNQVNEKNLKNLFSILSGYKSNRHLQS